MSQANISVIQKKTADLIPYINNAKIHSQKQVEMIAASIKEFGFNNPILTDGDNGVIAGHGRLQAAQKLKLDKVPTIELGHLSEAQKKAYKIQQHHGASQLQQCEARTLQYKMSTECLSQGKGHSRAAIENMPQGINASGSGQGQSCLLRDTGGLPEFCSAFQLQQTNILHQYKYNQQQQYKFEPRETSQFK
jgi:hypothetical protein